MLNSTISQMKSQKSSSPVSSNVNEDLNLLKKGMADTGGEIKKLSDESEGAKKTIALLSKLVKSLKTDVLHVKVINLFFFVKVIKHCEVDYLLNERD